jgi:hypothetical protein
MPIEAGRRVFVDFVSTYYEGVVLRDCEDWGAESLWIRDDEDGKVYELSTWNAYDVEVLYN